MNDLSRIGCSRIGSFKDMMFYKGWNIILCRIRHFRIDVSRIGCFRRQPHIIGETKDPGRDNSRNGRSRNGHSRLESF